MELKPAAIWAVGRNYAEHAKELGNEVPTEPLFFLKAGACLSLSSEILLPAWSEDIHHELEIALQFGPDLRPREIGLALDLTERAAQNRLKAKGQPWTLAKSFVGACPVSHFLPWESRWESEPLTLELDVNGENRQRGQSSQMIFPIPELLRFVRARFPVLPGDLLLTGTPAGVGPVRAGDQLQGRLKTASGEILVSAEWRAKKA